VKLRRRTDICLQEFLSFSIALSAGQFDATNGAVIHAVTAKMS
jgi:hypothetical protein